MYQFRTSFPKRILSFLLALSLSMGMLAGAMPEGEPFQAFAAAPSPSCSFQKEQINLLEGTAVKSAIKGTLPEDAFFLSDNEEAVTVDPFTGELTGVSAGNATISICIPQEPVAEPEEPVDPEESAPAVPERPTVGGLSDTELEQMDDLTFTDTVLPDTVLETEALPEPVLDPEVVENAQVLDTISVDCYRPSTYSVKKNGTDKSEPAPYRLLTVKNDTEDFPQKRVYSLFKQQFNAKAYPWLNGNGCSTVATADICQGYGVKKITPVWLFEKGIPSIAKKAGVSQKVIDAKIPRTGTGAPLGWWGIQNVLAYAGISSRIGTWTKDDNSDAVAAITKSLSEGRPVILMIHNYVWKGMKLSTGGNHFILLTGLDKDGYVLNSCGSNANCQTTNSSSDTAPRVKLTVSEILEHFVRYNKHPDRTSNKDFFFSFSGGSGTRVYLEVTTNEAYSEPVTSIAGKKLKLDKTEFTYNGEEHRPTVTIDGLDEDVDYTVTYSDNVEAGKATVTVEGMGGCFGTIQGHFNIKKAEKLLTTENQTVEVSATKHTFPLKASGKLGVKLNYSSDNSKIKVNSKGIVTVAKGYVGRATITVTAPETANTKKESKKLTITVLPKSPKLSSVTSPKKKTVQVKWKKGSVTGYQLQYAYDKSFESARTITIKKKDINSKTITGLASKYGCYVRMRSYKKVGKKNYYSDWSKTKAVKIK